MPTTVLSSMMPLAIDAQKYLRRSNKLKHDPVGLLNDADKLCKSLGSGFSGRFNLGSSSAYRFDMVLRNVTEAVSRSLGRSGSLIMPFTLDMQRVRTLPQAYAQVASLSAKEIAKFNFATSHCPGLRFDYALRNRHDKHLTQHLSKMFPGQSVFSDLGSAVTKEFSTVEGAIISLFKSSKWQNQRMVASSSVLQSVLYLFGYAIIGDKVSYEEMEPLVKMYRGDSPVMPICNRDLDPIDQERWIVVAAL